MEVMFLSYLGMYLTASRICQRLAVLVSILLRYVLTDAVRHTRHVLTGFYPT